MVTISFFFFIFCGKGKESKGNGGVGNSRACVYYLQKCDWPARYKMASHRLARSARVAQVQRVPRDPRYRSSGFSAFSLRFCAKTWPSNMLQKSDLAMIATCSCIWTLFNPKYIFFKQKSRPTLRSRFVWLLSFCLVYSFSGAFFFVTCMLFAWTYTW